MDEKIIIRIASPDDAKALLSIYAPYVEKTAITFEYSVPSVEEFAGRIEKTLSKYPYLVAQRGSEILGYAYAGVFKGRPAYDWSVETTIYVDRNKRKTGVGRLLYEALEKVLKVQNITNLYACIGYPEKEDEYLTKNSVEFHEHLGFRLVGEFNKCGYKFKRWYNMVWMEKIISAHEEKQPQFLDFPDVRELIKDKYKIE